MVGNSIGFTGRARGMTEAQKASVALILTSLKDEGEALHNDGEGADQEFAVLASGIGIKVNTTPAQTPMARNRTLVSLSKILVAAPPTDFLLKTGSGSWETIKYAWKAAIPVHIVLSDGRVVHTKAELPTA